MLKIMLPACAEGISAKNGCWLYLGGSNSGERRRKSTPNFKAWVPFCAERFSTTLIWRCCWCWPLPISILGEMERILKEKFASWLVNGAGYGGFEKGTAPPKLSMRVEPRASVWL